MESIPLNSSTQIQKPTLRPLVASLSAILAVAALCPPAPSANAQTSGAVPATCTISSSNTLTCSVTMNLSGVAGTFSGNALTLAAGSTPPPSPTPPAPAPSTPPTCTAISPGSQSVVQSSALSPLSANCVGATSYQWYTGGSSAPASSPSHTPIAGETNALYFPSSGAVGTTTYWVSATNSSGTTDNPASATVTVSAPVVSSVCPAGEPRVSTNFATYATNFTYQPIFGNSVFVMKLTVAAGDTTLGKTILPVFGFTQDDTTAFSNERTVSVSRVCNDFSASAIVTSGRISGGTYFVTTGDARGSSLIPTLSPGVWYINVRNDSCPGSENCSISGIWRNWNR